MKCSFCGKDQNEVFKLIVASDKTAICDTCVMDCLGTLIYPDEDEIYELQLEDETTEDNKNIEIRSQRLNFQPSKGTAKPVFFDGGSLSCGNASSFEEAKDVAWEKLPNSVKDQTTKEDLKPEEFNKSWIV
ncbi:MAG TPA: ClpX C4-type zinc finger protein [Candidatus Glassbacteria bacterium]|nr:ClpX C4-type zinc finger protein [Candidatus Glassbacteria bacterium]